ncbi:MAG: hypothetical protein KF726_13170 [Anaerolineae bacterium]|nr:hypothetical protein [Anaerolineae bacterium]
MRVVTNEQKLKRNRLLAQVLFFVSLGILLAGLILNTVIALSPLFWVVPCLVLPLGLLATVFSVRLTNQYIRLPHPEDAIAAGLKGINKRSVLYNYLPAANHILVTPTGIYALHTLYQSRHFVVDGEMWIDSKARGPLAPIFQFLKQENIGKPFNEAQEAADKAQDVIDKALPDVELDVQPVVVMIGARTTLDLEKPKFPVVYAEARKKPSLRALMRDEKRREKTVNLSDEQLEAIHEALVATTNGATLIDTALTDEEEG